MKIRHLILIALFGASLIVASEWYLDAYETSIRRDEMGQALVIIEELQERLKDSEELGGNGLEELGVALTERDQCRSNYAWARREGKKNLDMCLAILKEKGW